MTVAPAWRQANAVQALSGWAWQGRAGVELFRLYPRASPSVSSNDLGIARQIPNCDASPEPQFNVLFCPTSEPFLPWEQNPNCSSRLFLPTVSYESGVFARELAITVFWSSVEIMAYESWHLQV